MSKFNKSIVYFIVILGAVLSLFPFYVMITSATMKSGDVFQLPPKLGFGTNLVDNFNNLKENVMINRAIFNSFFVSLVYTFLSVLLCSMAGYALAKFDFKGKNIMFAVIMGTAMLPFQAMVVPLFNMMNKFGWINSYQAVIFPFLANIFGIFLMRQNIISFPTSIIESARIDGCGEFGIFFKVVVPSVKPAISVLSVYMFMGQWNKFMWPLIVLRTRNMYTLPVTLSTLPGVSKMDYGQIMLGAFISVLPILILFLLFQDYFEKGLLGGAVKG